MITELIGHLSQISDAYHSQIVSTYCAKPTDYFPHPQNRSQVPVIACHSAYNATNHRCLSLQGGGPSGRYLHVFCSGSARPQTTLAENACWLAAISFRPDSTSVLLSSLAGWGTLFQTFQNVNYYMCSDCLHIILIGNLKLKTKPMWEWDLFSTVHNGLLAGSESDWERAWLE